MNFLFKNSETTNENSEFFLKKSCAIILAMVFASPIIAFQFTYFLLAILYVSCMFLRWRDNEGNIKSDYFKAFFLFAAVALFLVAVHFPEVLNVEDDFRTIELVVIFCVFFMVLDSVSYLLNRYDFDLSLLAKKSVLFSFFFSLESIYMR